MSQVEIYGKSKKLAFLVKKLLTLNEFAMVANFTLVVYLNIS